MRHEVHHKAESEHTEPHKRRFVGSKRSRNLSKQLDNAGFSSENRCKRLIFLHFP